MERDGVSELCTNVRTATSYVRAYLESRVDCKWNSTV